MRATHDLARGIALRARALLSGLALPFLAEPPRGPPARVPATRSLFSIKPPRRSNKRASIRRAPNILAPTTLAPRTTALLSLAFLILSASSWPLTAQAQTYYFTGRGPSTPSVSTTAVACDADTIGAIRYNTATTAFEGCNGTAWADIRNGATAGAAGSQGNVQFNSGGNLAATPTFTFTSAGRLGVGTTAPAGALTVNSGSNTYIAQFWAPTNGTRGIVFIGGQYSGELSLGAYGSGNMVSNTRLLGDGATLQLDGGPIFLNGNVGISTPTPGTSLDVNGGVTMEPTAVTLTANNTVLATANRSYFRVTSDNTTETNRVFCFGAGTLGQVLIIEWTSSTNRGEIVSHGNCSSAAGAVTASLSYTNWAPKNAETILQLMYNGTHWIQIAGSANY